MQLNFIPTKTRVLTPPKDEIFDILDGLDVKDGDIIFITSKVLAIHQGRCVEKSKSDKLELIKKEASHWLPYTMHGGFKINLTITDNILIAAAGIDESNGDDYYILWPEHADKLCAEIRKYLMKKHGVKKLGVVATDSHSTPLRWGVTGFTVGFAGIQPLNDIRGHLDIFGRALKYTKVNLIDPLASVAVLTMGEAAEQTPIVTLRGYTGIPFNEHASMHDFNVAPSLDIYKPLLDVFHKQGEETK